MRLEGAVAVDQFGDVRDGVDRFADAVEDCAVDLIGMDGSKCLLHGFSEMGLH